MFDLCAGFPLLTCKRLHVPSIVHELMWFVRGDTNVAYLRKNGVSIWNEWADSNGDLGPIYGRQWRAWTDANGHMHDQLAKAVDLLRHDRYSRRILVSAWNVGALQHMRLPPCHCLFQFYASMDGGLSCQLYHRSVDIFLGLPFNIASYALLTHMVAHVSGLRPASLILTLGDTHLYCNHIAQARELLERKERPLPILTLNPDVREIDQFRFKDVRFENYAPHPHIPAAVAV